MEKFYKLAIDKGNEEAMFSLAYYHDSITHNYEEMEKYYLMAIDKGNEEAMFNLAYYHDNITHNYEEMEQTPDGEKFLAHREVHAPVGDARRKPESDI